MHGATRQERAGEDDPPMHSEKWRAAGGVLVLIEYYDDAMNMAE